MALHSIADVTLTATATALSSTSVRCAWVQVQAKSLSAAARIGDSLISTSRGGIINQTGDYQFAPTLGNANAYDLSSIYVLGTQGDTVAVLYDTN